MTADEARTVLGVAPDASIAQIGAAFRRAAKQAHTDTESGDRDEWERVVAARDALLDHGDALVRVDIAQALVRSQSQALERVEKRNERTAATESAVRSVMLRHTSPLDRKKRAAWTAGAVAAGVGTLITVIRTVAVGATGYSEGVAIAAFMAGAYIVAGLFTLIGFVLQFRAQQLTHAVEDVTAQLSRRANYLSLLNEIRESAYLPMPWGTEEFNDAIEEWAETTSRHPSSLASTARDIGSRDFAELVIAKGVELEVLDEEAEEMEENFFVSFRIRRSGGA